MPLIANSSYQIPNRWWRNAHVQTILPSLIRRLFPISYQRNRLELVDGDFLDVDYCISQKNNKQKIALICHGLEGSSRAPYVKGMARFFHQQNWDVAAMNFRSCSGELNRLPQSYHSGETGDLGHVLEQLLKDYQQVVLIGFSLSGNAILKYLGEQGANINKRIKAAVVLSVPCDLAGSGESLKKPANKLYMSRFLRMLEKKVGLKYQRGDAISSPELIKTMTSFWEFDDTYTGPLHGFKGADDYYQQSSSAQYVDKIKLPTLLVNARNDPFLSPQCFPEKAAQESQFFYLEIPKDGGHCGFPTGFLLTTQWHEKRALEFFKNII